MGLFSKDIRSMKDLFLNTVSGLQGRFEHAEWQVAAWHRDLAWETYKNSIEATNKALVT